MNDGRPFPFRWLLPLAQLTFCVAIMWTVWHYLGGRAWRHVKTDAKTVEAPAEQINLNITLPFTPEQQHQIDLAQARFDLPASLNLPAGFLQIPYAAYSSEKTEWIPKNIDPLISYFPIWRSLTWPFLGIVFWWMVGRSIEALFAARTRLISPRIRWIEVICGLAIGFLSGGLFIMTVTGSEPWHEKELMMGLGSGLWTILGAAIVATFIIQWRLRRRAKNQLQESAQGLV